MTAQINQLPNENQPLLPKEPLDLPKESLDLPPGKTNIPSATANEPNQNTTVQESHLHDVKTLLSWSAPGRPFKKRNKQFYLTGLLIMFLVEIILFLFNQTIFMALVGSVVFLAFTLDSVTPKNFHYKISTEGITIEDHFFLWQELYDFYFKKQHGIDVVHIRTRGFFPGELVLTLGDMHKTHAKSALLPFLPYREIIKPTFMEKSADWLSSNFPLEKN